MAEAVKGTRRAYSIGNLMLYVQPLTLVMDASTHASGLARIVGYWANSTSQACDNIKTGCDLTENGSGTFTFRMPDITYGKSLDLYILSEQLE